MSHSRQLKQIDYSVTPDDDDEEQLASALARIRDLQRSKVDFQTQIITVTRELQIKNQLLRNASIRERELRIKLGTENGWRRS